MGRGGPRRARCRARPPRGSGRGPRGDRAVIVPRSTAIASSGADDQVTVAWRPSSAIVEPAGAGAGVPGWWSRPASSGRQAEDDLAGLVVGTPVREHRRVRQRRHRRVQARPWRRRRPRRRVRSPGRPAGAPRRRRPGSPRSSRRGGPGRRAAASPRPASRGSRASPALARPQRVAAEAVGEQPLPGLRGTPRRAVRGHLRPSRAPGAAGPRTMPGRGSGGVGPRSGGPTRRGRSRARSTIRPVLGGHSTSTFMLRIRDGSRSPSTPQPRTTLPDRIRTSPRSIAPSARRRVARLLLELAVRGLDQRLAVVRGALGDRPRAGVTASPDRAAGMGDEDLDVVVDAAVQEESGGQLGHRQVRGGYRAHESARRNRTVPSRPRHCQASLALSQRPRHLHLVGLAASSAAVRGPGPMITHRSGVGTTGPFGQTERYRRALGPTTGLSTKLRPGDGKLSTIPAGPWTTCPHSCSPAGQESATTPRADRAGATSWWRRQRAS